MKNTEGYDFPSVGVVRQHLVYDLHKTKREDTSTSIIHG